MLPTKIFRESPFKALKILGLILGGIYLLLVFLLISDEIPRMTAAGLNDSAFLLVILAIVFAGAMVLTFLILSFQLRKTVKCDFEGCEISQANYWQSSGSSEYFKWSDVRDTKIVEEIDDAFRESAVSIYTFVAETNTGQFDLLEFKTSTKRNIEGLINYVDQATPHSKYVWIKDENIGNRTAIDSVYGFSKIARKD